MPKTTTPQMASVDVAAPATLPVGSTGVPGATVHLTSATASDLFIQATSANPAALTFVGAGVTVPAGQTSGVLNVNIIEASPGVTITLTLGAQSMQATIVAG